MKSFFKIALIFAMFVLTCVKASENANIDANFSGRIINDMDGKSIVLNVDIMPKINVSSFTVELNWDGNNFDVESYSPSGEMHKNDNGVVIYLPSNSRKLQIALSTMNELNMHNPITLKILASPLNEEEIQKSPEILVLQKEISLSANDNSDNISAIPQKLSLHQNYPNPFNDKTYIEYDIPEREKISLSIYDVSGKNICTLIDDEVNPGYYRVFWNGKDNAGKTVQSGIYFAKLKTTSENRTIKLQFLK